MTRDFHMPFNEVMDELPLIQAFALAAWNAEANPWTKLDRATDGYIAQERWCKKDDRSSASAGSSARAASGGSAPREEPHQQL